MYGKACCDELHEAGILLTSFTGHGKNMQHVHAGQQEVEIGDMNMPLDRPSKFTCLKIMVAYMPMIGLAWLLTTLLATKGPLPH